MQLVGVQAEDRCAVECYQDFPPTLQESRQHMLHTHCSV